MLSGLVAAGNYRALVAARNNRTGQDNKTCAPETLLLLFLAWLLMLLFFYYTQVSDSTT
jgi:hypothetical protein